MKIVNEHIVFDNGFTLGLIRTVRIPDDGKNYKLPPGLGRFPIKRVEDYLDKVPESWKEHGGVFFPMYQREAMWMSFTASQNVAIKVASGKINAVSGEAWNIELQPPKKNDKGEEESPQDYMISPGQPWLDGFNAGKEQIKQFVAMPLGQGYTVEGQVTGEEKVGGLQVIAYPIKEEFKPKWNIQTGPRNPLETYTFGGTGSYQPYLGEIEYKTSGGLMLLNDHVNEVGISMDWNCNDATPASCYASNLTKSAPKGAIRPRSMNFMAQGSLRSEPVQPQAAEMGLAAGGKMEQKIYVDSQGVHVWDQSKPEKVFIHIVNSEMYKQITGEDPPKSPITAKEYAKYGYPYFTLYDENKQGVSESDVLKEVKSVAEIDADASSKPLQDDTSLPQKYQAATNIIHNKKW